MTIEMSTTAASVSTSMQDYLKACYQLSRKPGGIVTMSKLASHLHVSAPSVTNMVKKLQKQELLTKSDEGALLLTSRGTAIALEMVRHHRLLETFLINELGMDWADAHREAEVLEHYISETLENLLDKYMERPKHDPQGEPIPSKAGKVPGELPPSLLDFEEDSTIEILQVRSQDPALLKYLQERELVPGTIITIRNIGPFNGPIAIGVKRKTHHISRDVAACIYGQHSKRCAA